MKDSDPHLFAMLAGESLVREMKLSSLPIDPFAIAQAKDIEVVAKPARDKGVSGMLIRVGEVYAIAYATHIDNVPFQRFSVGHELGHYCLPGHPAAVLGTTGIHESRAEFRSKDRYEIEADRFAAGLLMPRHLFVPALNKSKQGLAAIEALADLCKTSLHATAIRYAQFCPDRVAVIVSIGDRIDHCFMSDELKEVSGIDWIRKRDAVPRSTVTYTFNQDEGRLQRSERTDGASAFQDWFGGQRDIEVTEEVIGLGGYGRTLTILSNIEIPDAEDEADEEAMRDSWNPRFRR